MDTYDAWSHELMCALRRTYIQIGGHGRWIQSDYNGTYIAVIKNLDKSIQHLNK